MAIDGTILVRSLIRSRTHLLAYIIAIVHNDHIAEDVYQEVCGIAYQKREEIQDEQHLLGWLRIAARHESFKALRDRHRSNLSLDDGVLNLLDADWKQLEAEVADAGERTAALRSCIDELSPYARELIQLRYGEGVTGKALADRLQRELNTIYVALTRLHRSLGDCIRRRLMEDVR